MLFSRPQRFQEFLCNAKNTHTDRSFLGAGLLARLRAHTDPLLGQPYFTAPTQTANDKATVYFVREYRLMSPQFTTEVHVDGKSLEGTAYRRLLQG